MRVMRIWSGVVVLALLAFAGQVGVQAAGNTAPQKPADPPSADDTPDDTTPAPESDAPDKQAPPPEHHEINLTPGGRAEGDYGGVTPGKSRRHDDGQKARQQHAVGPKTVTWLGFQAKDGAALVFVQLSTDVAPSQKIEGKTLVVSFPGAKLGRSHHFARFLDTRFFKTDVVRVQAKATRGGIAVHVTFKDAPRQAKIDSTTGDGGAMVALSF